MPRAPIIALLLGAVLTASTAAQDGELSPIGDEAFALLERQAAYDPVPLAPRQDTLRQTPNGTLYKVVFTGAGGRRVAAHLELPLHFDPPYPVVVLVHGLGRAKEYWWSFATTTEGKLKDRLVAAGYAVAGLDLPAHGERASEGDYENPAVFLGKDRRAARRDLFLDAVVDHRRALDLLETRADIDGGRVGLLGYGLGGTVAAAVTALDGRVATAIACVPPTVRDRLSVLALQSYAPRIAAPFFLLMAANSPTSARGDGDALHALVGADDKELKVYTSDDRLPIWYVGDVVGWLEARLAP